MILQKKSISTWSFSFSQICVSFEIYRIFILCFEQLVKGNKTLNYVHSLRNKKRRRYEFITSNDQKNHKNSSLFYINFPFFHNLHAWRSMFDDDDTFSQSFRLKREDGIGRSQKQSRLQKIINCNKIRLIMPYTNTYVTNTDLFISGH